MSAFFCHMIFVFCFLASLIACQKPATIKTAKDQPSTTLSATRPGWKVFKSEINGIRFEHPENFLISENGNIVSISHSVRRQHYYPCDFSDEPTLRHEFTDFSMSLTLSDKSLEEKMHGIINVPGFEEDLAAGKGKEWFEVYEAGNLKGYRFESGAEGCGMRDYLFPLSQGKILHVTESVLYHPPTVEGQGGQTEKLNGILLSNDRDQIFRQILETFER